MDVSCLLPRFLIAALYLASHCTGSPEEETLYQRFLANNVPVRPVTSFNETVHVSIDFFLFQILELDGNRETLHTTGFFSFHWYDPKLTWNEDEYGGTQCTLLPAYKFWTPVFGITNSATVARDDEWEKIFPMGVCSEGIVYWQVYGKFETSCDVDMSAFPFDQQTCYIEVSNLIHADSGVNFTDYKPEVNLNFYVHNSEFEMDSTNVQYVSRVYEGIPVNMSAVRFNLTFKRKHLYYSVSIILPCVMLSVLSLLVFAIPNDADEKLSLGITVMLSYTVFLLILNDITPPTSDYMPFLTIYLGLVIVVSSMSMICCCLSLNMHHHSPARPVPDWLRTWIIGRMAYVLCFPMMSKPKAKRSNYVTPQVTDEAMRRYIHSHGDHLTVFDSKQHSTNETNAMLQTIVNELKKITMKVDVDEADEILREEWQLVGQILDRFFLFIFLIIELVIAIIAVMLALS